MSPVCGERDFAVHQHNTNTSGPQTATQHQGIIFNLSLMLQLYSMSFRYCCGAFYHELDIQKIITGNGKFLNLKSNIKIQYSRLYHLCEILISHQCEQMFVNNFENIKKTKKSVIITNNHYHKEYK